MKKKYIFLIAIIFFLALTTIHAESNDTAISVSETPEISDEALAVSEDTQELSQSNEEIKLEESYYYDAYDDEFYDDDTVITNNVVKYYGDTSKKFKIKVLDDDYNEMEGVYVSFGRNWDNLKEKQTNYYGNVYFPINYKVGTHYVMTYIECENDDGTINNNYFIADNIVTIKSTIPTKTLTKHINEKNKKFAIKFLTTKGKPLKNTQVKIKVKGKTYKVKTNSKGIAYIKINSFKVGKHSITAINPKSKEQRKITVTIKKKAKVVTMSIKYKWTTKKVGKYTIKARLWKVYNGLTGYYKDVDIILCKNGKQLNPSKYLSKYKYKENGKWKWWKTWRHGGVDHAYHRYATKNPVSQIKVKFTP